MKRKNINIHYIDSPAEVVAFRLVYEELPLSLPQTQSIARM
jgi:hypothetical protein